MTATFSCASVQVRWQFFYETALDSGVSFNDIMLIVKKNQEWSDNYAYGRRFAFSGCCRSYVCLLVCSCRLRAAKG